MGEAWIPVIPRMTITMDEFNEVARKLTGTISIEYGDPIDIRHVAFCQWIIERVADGTILVEEP